MRKCVIMKLFNQTQDVLLLADLRIANTFFKRFLGLMGQTLGFSEGLLIRPCNSIHCFFMKIPIDVLFVDKNDVVIKVMLDMKPGAISPIVKSGAYVIECCAGVFTGVVVGDQLQIE